MNAVTPPRVPIDPAFVERRLADREVPWPRPVIKVSTGSTNADLVAMARQGAPEGTTVVADEQTAGRGRLGRTWVSAPGAGLWFSVLVRLDHAERAGIGRLPLLVGVAVADAIRRHGVGAMLKWPNDVVVDGAASDGSPGPRKLAGILMEADGEDAVVVGIGVNVSQTHDGLPVPAASSLLLEGSAVSRDELLVDILTAIHAAVEDLRRRGGAATLDEYRRLCLTVGRDVIVALPSGLEVAGRAAGIADDGQLVVESGGKVVYVAAGDVIHATI